MRPPFIESALVVCTALTAASGALASTPLRSNIVAQNNDRSTTKSAPGAAPTAVPSTLSIADLEALVPAKIGAWSRVASNVPRSEEKLPGEGKTLESTYRQKGKEALLSIGDTGGQGVTAPWIGPPAETATETGTTKTYAEGKHTVREESNKKAKTREVTIILGTGIVVRASSAQATMAELKQLAHGVDLARGEAIARPGR